MLTLAQANHQPAHLRVRLRLFVAGAARNKKNCGVKYCANKGGGRRVGSENTHADSHREKNTGVSGMIARERGEGLQGKEEQLPDMRDDQATQCRSTRVL